MTYTVNKKQEMRIHHMKLMMMMTMMMPLGVLCNSVLLWEGVLGRLSGMQQAGAIHLSGPLFHFPFC